MYQYNTLRPVPVPVLLLRASARYITTVHVHDIGDVCITLVHKSVYRCVNAVLQGNQYLIGKNQLIRRC
jgi:hypothetical protein